MISPPPCVPSFIELSGIRRGLRQGRAGEEASGTQKAQGEEDEGQEAEHRPGELLGASHWN